MTVLETTLPPKLDAPVDAAGPTTMEQGGTESLPQGVIRTDVSRSTAKWMTILFVAGIFALPAMQLAVGLVRGDRLQELDLLKPPAKSALALSKGDVRGAARELKWLLKKDNLHAYEEALKDNSYAKRLVQPRVQLAMSSYFGFGNPMAIIARDGFKPNGWLYYQLGVDYLAGPGLLDPNYIHLQEQGYLDEGDEDVNCDPRKAIVRFHEDCARAGVHLVYVPVPVKPMIVPAQMGRRLRFTGEIPTPNNRDYERFIADLRAAGVDVFDSYVPKTIRADDEPRFLEQDTHWTPQWMEQVARELAGHVKGRVSLPPSDRAWKVEPTRVARVGDVVDALNLPDDQTLFQPQEVTINRVLGADTGKPLESNPDADVLVIGDSFSNIFHGKRKRWGDAAGFPEQIARFLGRDVDIMVRDGSAASDLRRELAGRPQPLRGKRVIIWEVAMHELVFANWQVIPIDANQSDAAVVTKAQP